MITITPSIHIDESELEFDFVRSSGPGGQNVNKVSSAVQLRFNVAASPSLPEDVKGRLARLEKKRMTEEGVLLIDARRFRTQMRNREDAVARLVALIQRAAHRPKPRRSTRPTRSSVERRLVQKKRRGRSKQLRGRVSDDE